MEEPRNTPFTNTEDRISKLPDDIILLIFSFLDMKHVVQTSVLARRWRSIWISLLILNFNLDLFKSTFTGCTDHDAFTAFVNWILMVRHSNSDEEDNSFPELSDPDKELCAASMIRLLESLHCVRDLALSCWFLEAVSEDPQLLLDELSDHFRNLQNLKLQTFLSEESICAITHLLNVSTNIESLKVIIVEFSMKDFIPNPLMYSSLDEIMFDPKADDWEQVLLPLYHLKFVMIVGVQCRINELKFLKMLFKKAVALEKVFLYYDSVSTIVAEAFSRKLMTFPIASSSISLKWWIVQGQLSGHCPQL
ncbi:putative F-box/LRR-repeat protein At5g54820 isoform X5 [Papaver somniferum]|uniref:putative F-box/LRR-repeat protein At5g54820 isoform X5 n=1 Tax=Papaver somniferum TaxID=3469 RepID=UPI000E6F6152|nr:putative F-box/LRR-repeat protein At5g54820 isoform X5 [Papaver somniferum]